MSKTPINISQTDQNLDWIKTPENRESEIRIHQKISKNSRGDVNEINRAFVNA